jgi:hypothetical protein
MTWLTNIEPVPLSASRTCPAFGFPDVVGRLLQRLIRRTCHASVGTRISRRVDANRSSLERTLSKSIGSEPSRNCRDLGAIGPDQAAGGQR